jgi:hypothetical protein
MHILFPHEPNAYLPGGENYGLVWMRGQMKELWGDVEWGVISGKQRHVLQVQYADQLLNNLLDHLQEQQMLDESLVIVVADHGISFALNDTRRALSDINKAALLRVPMFIKLPGQVQGQRVERQVMTIDILPTLLATLGFSSESLELDGIDLSAAPSNQPRQRYANSHLDRPLKKLDEAELDISKLVAETRRQLKLNDPARALWEIGPYDKFRGQAMETVCEKSPTDITANYEDFSPLPNTNPQDALPAYVVGTFTGKNVVTDSKPFLITSNGLIVASGYTWAWDIHPIFFALVEPKYVKQKDWNPKAWLTEDRECFGAVE